MTGFSPRDGTGGLLGRTNGRTNCGGISVDTASLPPLRKKSPAFDMCGAAGPRLRSFLTVRVSCVPNPLLAPGTLVDPCNPNVEAVGATPRPYLEEYLGGRCAISGSS